MSTIDPALEQYQRLTKAEICNIFALPQSIFATATVEVKRYDEAALKAMSAFASFARALRRAKRRQRSALRKQRRYINS